MNPLLVLVAASAMGVSFGWQPTSDGSLEYIVQLDAATLQNMLKSGDVVVSDIPSDVRGGRRIVIKVSGDEAPRRAAGASAGRGPVLAAAGADYTRYRRNVADGPLDTSQRWINPTDLGGSPDDPNFGHPPVEPYRPITPSFPAVQNDPLDRSRYAQTEPVRPQVSLYNVPSAQPAPTDMTAHVHKPSITKADLASTVTPTSITSSSSSDENAPKPWLALTMVALLLFISLGANLYLGWLARDYYLRYREIATGEPAGIL